MLAFLDRMVEITPNQTNKQLQSFFSSRDVLFYFILFYLNIYGLRYFVMYIYVQVVQFSHFNIATDN